MAEITDLKITQIALCKNPANKAEFLIEKALDADITPLEGESDADATWRKIETEFDKWSALQDEQMNSLRSQGKAAIKQSREQRLAGYFRTEEGKNLFQIYRNASNKRTEDGPNPIAKMAGESEKDARFRKIEENAEIIAKNLNVSSEQKLAKYLQTDSGKAEYEAYIFADEERPLGAVESDEPRTLEEYGNRALTKIVKEYQGRHNMGEAQATLKAVKESDRYRQIYSLMSECYPIEKLDYTTALNKSQSSAVAQFKTEIDRLLGS